MVDFQEELDVRNLGCPMPVMRTKKALKKLESGKVIHVMATDPASVEDITTLIESQSAEILEQNEEEGVFHFYIKQG